MSLRNDRGLAVRMAAALAVVVAANALFVGVVVTLVAPWLGTAVRRVANGAGVPDAVAALWWLPLAVALVAGSVWAQLRYVRRETLAAVDAERAHPQTYPDLDRRLTRLAAQTAVPTPDCYVVDSETPNSFALDGAGPPTVVVSTGLLTTLDGDRLDAVLAHELAHLQHRDATVMTLASFLPALTGDRYSPLDHLGPWARSRAVWAAALAALYAVGAVATATSPFDPGYALGFAGGLVAAVVVGGVALGAFAVATTVAARRLSHYREFAADRAAGRLSGDPAALADALATLDGETTEAPATDKRLAYDEVRGLCLLPAGFASEAADPDEFHVETRSHPPTDERVARLRELIDRQ
ncbi:protease heat shock protein HtpX [Halosimplex carlsbadense 2-9-1]|uniref:Protease heat shock protein HtpX n=1 Tax=Halosimplex carlsbadense 2-9-1 TaxID=797114 RepID=M0CTQ2_9EURY|nr:M48 family metalloprotease [Halosimplex carlsbadense]ELZ25797.1 protease heat shock protein HtpX [Halosimplex carlsbadense 2-9-1]